MGQQEFRLNDFSRGLLATARRILLHFRHTHTCPLRPHPHWDPPSLPSAAKSLLPKSVRRNSCFPKYVPKHVLIYIFLVICFGDILLVRNYICRKNQHGCKCGIIGLIRRFQCGFYRYFETYSLLTNVSNQRRIQTDIQMSKATSTAEIGEL